MKRTKFLFFIAFLISGHAFAQDSLRVLTLSMEEARALSLKNNPDFTISALELDLARNSNEQSRLQRIPQIYGDLNIQRNLILPTTPVPARAFNPEAGEDELMHLRFTTKWTANTGINATIDLFNPERQGAIKKSELEVGLSETDQRIAQNQLNFDVGSAYYASLIARDQLHLAETDTFSKVQMLQMAEKQFEKGRLTLADLNLIKADLNNSRVFLEEARMIYNNSKASLLVLLGYRPDQRISIIFRDSLRAELNSFEKPNISLQSSLSLYRLKQEFAINAVQAKTARRGFLPIVSLNGYYGTNYFDNRFGIFKGNNWYGNSFVNIGIRVPISENLMRSRELSRLTIQKNILLENLKSKEHQNLLQHNEALNELKYRRIQYNLKKDNLKLAEENMEISRLQYENGRLLIGDYYQQIYQYQKERTVYLESLYKLFVSRLALEKAEKD